MSALSSSETRDGIGRPEIGPEASSFKAESESATSLLSLYDNGTTLDDTRRVIGHLLTAADNLTADGVNGSFYNGTGLYADQGRPAYYEDTPACKLYAFIVCTIIIGLLCIFGAIGNITAFAVFWKDNIKTSSSFLFQGLSFIDTVLLVTVFPIYCLEPIVEYTGYFQGFYHIRPFVLVYMYPMAMTAQTITIWVTVLVAVNRYIAVCKPYSASRLCTVIQARKQMALVIFLCIVYNIPRFTEAKLITVTNELNQTEIRPVYIGLGQSQLYLIIYNNAMYMIFLLILPLILLTILNVRLIRALNALRQKRQQMQSARQQQDNNVTFVLIIVVLVFTICQAPALVNQILWNVLSDEARLCGHFQYYYQRISNTLVVFNSSVNFLIYFLFNTRFRQVLVQCVCQKEYKTIRATNSNHTCKDVEGTKETLL